MKANTTKRAIKRMYLLMGVLMLAVVVFFCSGTLRVQQMLENMEINEIRNESEQMAATVEMQIYRDLRQMQDIDAFVTVYTKDALQGYLTMFEIFEHDAEVAMFEGIGVLQNDLMHYYDLVEDKHYNGDSLFDFSQYDTVAVDEEMQILLSNENIEPTCLYIINNTVERSPAILLTVKNMETIFYNAEVTKIMRSGYHYICDPEGNSFIRLGQSQNLLDDEWITDDNKEQLAEAIDTFSWEQPILIDDYRIIVQDLPNLHMKMVTVVPNEIIINDSLAIMKAMLYISAVLLMVLIATIVLILKGRTDMDKQEWELTYKDRLTGMYNMTGFYSIGKEILKSAPLDRKYYILDFDIVGFSGFNSLFGYDEGDRLIKNIAEKIFALLKEGEIAARGDGDHFTMLVWAGDMSDITANIQKAKMLFGELENSWRILTNYGIYPIEDRTKAFNAMVDSAKFAKNTIKGNVEKEYAVYDEKMYEKQLENMLIVNSAENAMTQKEFTSYYQPKYDLESGKITGAEALARWVKPNGEVIMPVNFIELFEKSSIILSLDWYMFRNACELLSKALKQGEAVVPIAVNFSRAHLSDENFVGMLKAEAAKYEVPRNLLEIEITESAIEESEEKLIEISRDICDAGFRMSIDDFGKGMSSLAVLKNITATTIKLDKNFIDDNCKSYAGQLVLKSVLECINGLGMVSLAEGVETTEQVDILKYHKCRVAQGYYYAKPMPKEEFLMQLQRDGTIIY